MTTERLQQQIGFILEIDKLKRVLRQTVLTDASRPENSAEHSWHIALMAFLLQDYAAGDIDPMRVAKMLLIHDIVEIDCGDTYCYDEQGMIGKYEREQAAAKRIFGLLPADQSAELLELWEEFEARETNDSRYANALDRFQPLLHNFATEGLTWRDHGVTADKVLARNQHIADGAPDVWEYAREMIREAVARGYLLESKKSPL
ncbi:MAG: HD domain-containing protein [Armatimonadetes bacterium]|nr:HD domain-containing protein [Armatimonadota bacterium]